MPWKHGPAVARRGLLIACALLLGSCGRDELLVCTDLLPPGTARFADVRALTVDVNDKSCSRCHNTTNPIYGLNFEGPGVAYDALTTHMPAIYDQLALGKMPAQGTRWSADDLRVLRSWYCQGAIYEPSN